MKNNIYAYCILYKHGKIYTSGTWKTPLKGADAYTELSNYLKSTHGSHVIISFNKI
jgi:hypothetical protein